MPRIPPPLSSFGPELQAVLRKGADAQVRLRFDSAAMATRFKHRVHSLRLAMKREKHPDWMNVYRCGLTDDPSDPCVVVVGPKDAEFRKFIQDVVPDSPAPAPVTSVDVPTPPPGTVDSFLADVMAETDVQKVLNEDTDEPPIDTL